MASMDDDLARSGLVASDMAARVLDSPERAATNTPHSIQGYVLPYFSMHGDSVPHYRVKLFDFDPKYKQPKDTANHVYFPKGFLELANNSKYVIITEGEKKAALGVKMGFPCLAFGGIESWRNRVFQFPADAEMNATDKTIRARIPAGAEAKEDMMSPLALGLIDLIDYIVANNKTVIIIYDTDNIHGTAHNVQRAAASLGYELRFRGVPFINIRQVLLPFTTTGDKVGLDDYLLSGLGKDGLEKSIDVCMAKRSAFPRHPNIRDFINKRLQSMKMSRKEIQAVSMAVLSELDAQGMRLKSRAALETYYFDQKTHKLLKTGFSKPANEMVDSPFGQFLYRKYGIGSADARLLQWLGAQFTGEDPIDDVQPYKVFARPPLSQVEYKDKIIYQISDGQYVELSAEVDEDVVTATPGLVFKDNGAENILFESEQVEPLDPAKLAAEYTKQYNAQIGRPLTSWWAEVLLDVRLVDKDKARLVTALLFYMSPWLLRWRGTQLPIEMTLGEAGSGKSTLQTLRLSIIDGMSKLRNAPKDMKDWSASVVNTGGLHITDNLQMADKNMRQHLSDELCRLVTEPYPSIEMRKYYTNADLLSLPVRCVFGITAIKQPFMNADVLQRGIMIELDKTSDLMNGNLTYDSLWTENMIHRYGGREAWAAHHLLVLHRFLMLARSKWNMRYQAKHRLINFEQAMLLMAEVFNFPKPAEWIPQYLSGISNKAITEADWAFEGIISFCNLRRMQNALEAITVQSISNWAMSDPEYEKCGELTETRRIGRYLVTHKSMVASVCGLIEDGKSNNRMRYKLVQKS